MEKIRAIVLLLVFSLLFITNSRGNDPVLMKINGKEITLSEFEYVYTKNNLNTQVIDPKTIEEYLELFINFNLKVYEAMQLGLDTHETFINELEGYRKQLAQPYLNDQGITNELLEEALERRKYDLRASHILLSIDEHASPADTLSAWKKINSIRDRIVAGENFEVLAREYSEDPSAKGMPATANRPAMRPNSGDLGYFNVLNMVYAFETGAYNTAVDEVSMPVRTNHGYHIIKVTDRLPAMGRARVAHLMVMTDTEASQDEIEKARIKIEEIYQKLKDGESFDELVQLYSDDKASARRNGELPAFNSNRMVPEFIKAIADLNEPGEFSPPVKTAFGWHIIKLIEKQLPEGDEALTELRNRISRDSRSQLSQRVVIERIKDETGFTENLQNVEPLYDIVDESVFQGRWSLQHEFNPDKEIFSFADFVVNQSDFANYIQQNQSMRSPESIRSYVNGAYADFVNKKLIDYEEGMLEVKYPEFKKIMKEYHDGILLFELTDQKVWSKAMQDTIGLKDFYQQNIQKYIWNDRLDGVVYTFSSESLAKSARPQIRRLHRRKQSHEALVNELNENSQLNVTAEKGLFERDQKPVLSQVTWKKGVSKVFKWNEMYYIVQVKDVLPSQPKKLNEIRGLVIADYQNYLEEKWITELRQKYNYSVNKELLQTLNID